MTSPARLSPRARQDLREAMRWIARERPRAAKSLSESVLALAQRLGEHALSGVERPELAFEPFRFAVVKGFPYVLIYDASRQPPMIIRILHGARDLPAVFRDLQAPD